MKFILEVLNNGPYIKAPSYCPYKFYDNSRWCVHSSLCPLCKMCEFEPDSFERGIELKTDEFIKYLTLINTQVSKSINGQIRYLQKENRIPLVILISPEVFDSMLKLIYRDDIEMYNLVHSYFLNKEIPLCYISGSPVLLNRKLTKSTVQVVGEIEWH